MTLIEGVGDEVTLVVTALLVLLIVCLAWISTNVPDLGGIRVIILDHTNFHRLGEIARRYQIIGYQIISGHVVRNRENPPDGEDSQSGEEGSEGDTSREGSGEDDSQNNSTSASRENVSQSESGNSQPEIITSQPEVVTNDTLPVTETEVIVPEVSRVSGHASNSDTQSADTAPQNSSAQSTPVTESSNLEHVENLGASSDSSVNVGDANELRRRRLAFYNKSDNSASNAENQDIFDGVSSNETPAPSDGEHSQFSSINTPAPSGGDVPVDGSSVDSQNVRSDTNTESAAQGAPMNAQSAPVNMGPSPAGNMRIRIKYLDDRQRQVEAKPSETIGEFKRKHFAGELAENMLVRFIYNGRELRHEASTLQSLNITDGSVIHCLLTRVAQQEENSHQQAQDEEFNMGALMFPLFGLILATIWYCRFTYRHYFNAMSTLILVGITLLYVIAGMAMYRHHVDHQHHHQQQHLHQD